MNTVTEKISKSDIVILATYVNAKGLTRLVEKIEHNGSYRHVYYKKSAGGTDVCTDRSFVDWMNKGRNK